MASHLAKSKPKRKTPIQHFTKCFVCFISPFHFEPIWETGLQSLKSGLGEVGRGPETTKAKAPMKPIGGDPPMATTRVGESLQRCCCSVSSLLRFSSDFLSHWALNSIMNLHHPYMTSPPIPTPGVATRTGEAIGDASKSHHLPRAKQWAPRHFEMRGDWFKFTHPFFATFLRQCLVFQCVSGISLVSSV